MTDETWQQTVRTWIGSAVGESILGLKLVRTEAWSTVWRCTSSQGVLWFKENSSTNPAEGAIHHVLAGLARSM